MKKIITIPNLKQLAVLFVLALSSVFTYGQHNHGAGGDNHSQLAQKVEQPPHRGVVKDAGRYKIEMVINSLLKENQMSFYVLKPSLKPIANKEITGVILFDFKDGTYVTDSLKKLGDDGFVVSSNTNNPIFCTVRFLIKDKIVSTVFPLSKTANNNTMTYTCTMHPEIESDTHGKCPKCNMDLVRKNGTQRSDGHNH